MRNLANEIFSDSFDAFRYAAAATRLGWPIVFVGSDTSIDSWLVWVAHPYALTSEEARRAILLEM